VKTERDRPPSWSVQRLFSRVKHSGKPLVPISVFAIVVGCLGLAAHIVILVLAGNNPVGSLSGVSDQARYYALSQSILQGRGLSYAGVPTALRPPLYPILLAAAQIGFGPHYAIVARLFQFLICLALASVAGHLASRLFGAEARLTGIALALALPTLMFITTELQTEALTAFITGLFLYFMLSEIKSTHAQGLGMGASAGVAMLLRFNSALLFIIGATVCVWPLRNAKRAIVVCTTAGIIIAPWIIRNAKVFNGSILYSSHGGINLLEGVLTPSGRAQNAETERIRAAVGWVHTDIETNDESRLNYPREDQLDRQARLAAIQAWASMGWKSRLRLLASKVACFWLSTDQLLATRSFSPAQRLLRAIGVFGYWVVLALAIVAWGRLMRIDRSSAGMIAFYAAFVTAAHLPFVMNTRLRIPFMDFLLVVLAAGGISTLAKRANGTRTNEEQGTHL